MKNRNLPLKIAAVCFMFSLGQANAQDFKSLIHDHLAAKNTFLKANLNNFEIINEDFSKSMNGDVIKFQQSYNGIPVYNAVGTALIKDSKISYANDSFAKTYNSVTLPSVARANKTVFATVAQTLGLKDAEHYELIGINEADRDDVAFAKTRLMYFQTQNGDLRLTHEFQFEEKGTSNYWDILADASTGEILSKQNLTVSCTFPHGTFAHDYSSHTTEGFDVDFSHATEASQTSAAPTALAALDASYMIFPLPVESPNHGGRVMVSNPWLLDASPDGWHTIAGGTYVGSYNTTRGNNVMAYDDKASTNSPGSYADGGANRIFNFPFVANDTTGNLNAATTNLFYLSNKMHDVFYRLGFTETSRNFQGWNFGKGGAQNDYVMAESQDGGGTNNANFSTPGDGSRPRMQMYLWNPAVIERVFYNAPTEAVGRLVANVVSTTFGPTLTATGVTADVQLSPVLDGCTALPAGSLTGKIGLIERGTCDFVVKVKNAQNAGASAAIIYSLPTSTPTGGMGGTDASITIPSVLIENSEGVYMKNLLTTQNVNITLKYDPATQKTRDGSFDNGIIAHEYGHGISTRLIGGLNANANKEQMGEGWSDFFGLMLTNRPGDNASVSRGIGTYATSEAITGGGIRPAPYSPDFAVNNYTYNNTNGMEYTNTAGQLVPDVHAIGFVWASILWDLHWKYAAKYGYSSDVMANTNNGSTRVLQLVVDALKITPVNPGFIMGRDAILAAEEATTQGKDKCIIWEVFAKRGVGVNASAGSATNINDQVADFTAPAPDPRCTTLATSDVNANKAFSIYPNPAKSEFFLKSNQSISGKVIVEIFDASGKLVSSQNTAASEAVNTQALPNGVYVVKVKGLGVDYSTKLMIKK